MFGLDDWMEWVITGAVVVLVLCVVITIMSCTSRWYVRRTHKHNIIDLILGNVTNYSQRFYAREFLQKHLHVVDVRDMRGVNGRSNGLQTKAITIELDLCGMRKQKLMLFAKVGPRYMSYTENGIPIVKKKDNTISTYLSKRLDPKDVVPIGTTTHMDPYERDEVEPANITPPVDQKDSDLGCEIWETVDRIPGAPTNPLPFADKYM